MVDLNLASSYIPVFICMIKSLIVCIMSTHFLHWGGISALIILVLFDRLFINSEFIVDINFVLGLIMWSQLSTFERHHKGATNTSILGLTIGLNCIWAFIGIVQILKPAVFRFKNELLIYGLCGISLSFTHFAQESLLQAVVRVIAFNTSMFLQIYWQISSFQEESLIANLMRNGLILVGHPTISCITFFIYLVLVVFRWKPITNPSIPVEQDCEAAVLREALALRKEKASN